MIGAGRVGGIARALGFAGLLPQVVACLLLGLAGWRDGQGVDTLLLRLGLAIATIYPAAILSFLGGMWWSFAMRREVGQGRFAAVAVLPSLVAVLLLIGAALGVGRQPILLAMAGAILATLPVDSHLAANGEAPKGWMRLRTPLSLGLGGLTMLAAMLVP